jgi:hypothetical protein
MANPYGIKLDDQSLRWAAAEGVPESVNSGRPQEGLAPGVQGAG